MVPDDVLKKVSLNHSAEPSRPLRKLTPHNSRSVPHQVNGFAQRSLAPAQAHDDVHVVVHLHDLRHVDGRPAAAAHSHLARDWQDAYFGHGSL
jgi:hypothetical protein